MVNGITEVSLEEKTGVAQQKRIMRRNILAFRDGISVMDRETYNAEIRKNVLTHPVYCEAEIILAYASYKSEVDTTALIKRALADGKIVFVPKVDGDEMEFWRITSMEDLREGYRGIPEPAGSVSFPDWLARHCGKGICRVMMWMPGVVFDQAGHRIGYGKGFYDRYLQRLACMTEENCGSSADTGRKRPVMLLTVAALAYRCQVLAQIPYEAHDIKPDMLVTEEGVITGMINLIKSRTSYRGKYKKVPVPRKDLTAIMEAGLAAPSGCNKQTTSLIAVDDENLLKDLKELIDPPVCQTAPAFILVLTQKIYAYRDRCFQVQDYSACIENMLLAIKSLGYESCWYEGHITDEDDIAGKLAQRLGVPEEYKIVCLLPVGVAEDEIRYAAKKDFAQRAWFNGFGR